MPGTIPRLDPNKLYKISAKKAPYAIARALPGGRFLVFANSRAAAIPTDGFLTAPQIESSRANRSALIALGVLAKEKDEETLRFTQDFVFKSCHEAAKFILGHQTANGFDHWKALV